MIAFQGTLYIPALAALFVSAPASASEAVTVRGSVGQINLAAGWITVEPVAGRDVTLDVTTESRLVIDSKPTTLARFDKGEWVRATYVTEGATNEIVLLRTAVATDEELDRELKRVRGAVEGHSFRQKVQYEEALRGVLDATEDRIDRLRAEAKDVGSADQSRTRLVALRYRRATLAELLTDVSAATADKWDGIKIEVAAAVADLEKMLDGPSKN